MKRKTGQMTKPSRGRKVAKSTAREKARPVTAQRDEIGVLVTAGAQALGLTLDPAWQASVAFNLKLILRHAALVDEFPLPDDAEPAPIYHA
jgi:hypothetical protein